MRRGMPVPTRTTTVEISLQRLNSRPVTLDNFLNVGDAVEVDFKLVELLEDLGVAGNFGVGTTDDAIGFVVLQLGEPLGLVAEMLDALLNACHEMVEVPS